MFSSYKIRESLVTKLFTKVNTEFDFLDLALQIFNFQYQFNNIYKKYVDLLGVNIQNVKEIKDIPFLPIELFKSNIIKSGTWSEECIFKSSSTSGNIPSKNFVKEKNLYLKNTEKCFEASYGPINEFKWYALLPSYLEQGQSSLVAMADHFMHSGSDTDGGFYMNDYSKLLHELENDQSSKKKILLGVSYALLDLATTLKPDLNGLIVVETGGMKGRAKEMPRDELYEVLMKGLNLSSIHSEYGMTELFSQAYSKSSGLFRMSPSMRVLISDINDPLSILPSNNQGKVNIIDLANIDTCSFIATDDLGIVLGEDKFKILGRTDASETRGCNLLYTT